MGVRRFALASAVAAMLTAVVCQAQAAPATSPSNELARQFLGLARENLAHVDDEMLADMGNADVCAVLANLGQVSEASKLAASMKSYRAEAFVHIAESQADQGDAKGAAATLRQEVSTAPQAKPDDLDTLASAMAKLGDLEGASEAAERMPPSSYRADLLAHLAVAQAKAGDMPAARKSFLAASGALKTSHDEFPAIRPLGIVQLQLRTGDLEGAQRAVQDLSSKTDMAHGYAVLGQAAAAKNDRDAARSQLEKAKSLLEAAHADEPTTLDISNAIDEGLAILAGKTAKEAAQTELAARRKVLEAMDPTSEVPPELLADLALAQRRAGDQAAAEATMKAALAKVEQLGNTRGERTHARWVVASSVAASGDVAGALQLVELAMKSPIDPVETGFVAAQVADSLARLPAAAADFQWITKLSDPRQRGLAYAAAAAGLTERKGREEE